MLSVIFTLDYEIHGNGEGSPNDLMVEPTARMLDLFDQYGAKLTIMADVAEILKFREYQAQFGRDDYYYDAIIDQLRDAIRRGHDVQLHLHCSFFNAKFVDNRWKQDWKEYDFARLGEERLNEVLRLGKHFLEEELQVVDPGYRCCVFRAANWAVSPSRDVVRALVANGFSVDSSVFKYGRRDGIVQFDYTNAASELSPWLVNEDDICARDDNGRLLEVPIYSERRWIGAFLSRNRFYRARQSRQYTFDAPSGKKNPGIFRRAANGLRNAFRRHAWKADFNQCTSAQLIQALRRAQTKHDGAAQHLPFVLIGHSKLFTPWNERDLHTFLQFVADSDDFQFDDLRHWYLHNGPVAGALRETVFAEQAVGAARA